MDARSTQGWPQRQTPPHAWWCVRAAMHAVPWLKRRACPSSPCPTGRAQDHSESQWPWQRRSLRQQSTVATSSTAAAAPCDPNRRPAAPVDIQVSSGQQQQQQQHAPGQSLTTTPSNQQHHHELVVQWRRPAADAACPGSYIVQLWDAASGVLLLTATRDAAAAPAGGGRQQQALQSLAVKLTPAAANASVKVGVTPKNAAGVGPTGVAPTPYRYTPPAAAAKGAAAAPGGAGRFGAPSAAAAGGEDSPYRRFGGGAYADNARDVYKDALVSMYWDEGRGRSNGSRPAGGAGG
jgi:hypothetical protein